MMSETSNSSLTAEQTTEAKKHERIVDEGLLGYVATGNALMAIRDQGLYVGKFAEYVMTRFDLKSHAAYRTIRAADVANRLKAADLMEPKNEAQAHLLHELINDPDEQISVWRSFLATETRPSLSSIREFVQKQNRLKVVKDENEDVVGEVDIESAHSIPPIEFPNPDAEPLACLKRAFHELRAVSNAIDDGFDDLESLRTEFEQINLLLQELRTKFQPQSLAV